MIRITEKSLIEQMGLSEREIARRPHLLDFTDHDATAPTPRSSG